MVNLTITALKGNQGGRFYPYSGYLGLTKVLVEGVVRCRIDGDHKLIPASSLTIAVRCYEARTRYTVTKYNILLDAVHNLWTPSNGAQYQDLGEGEYPFRIVLPIKVGGLSTMTFPDYKVFWKLEAGECSSPILFSAFLHTPLSTLSTIAETRAISLSV